MNVIETHGLGNHMVPPKLSTTAVWRSLKGTSLRSSAQMVPEVDLAEPGGRTAQG